VIPKLEEAPRLPNNPRPAVVLPTPVQTVSIRPLVQTGTFGSNVTPQANPKLPVPAAQDAGFDHVAIDAPVAQPTTIVTAGFDARSPDVRPTAVAARIQTGAFGLAAEPSRARVSAANVNHAGFDVVAETERTAAPEQIRKAGFDPLKAASTPAKQKPSATVAVRPIEILDKPKPAYTAEARTEKIEGTVLLDVIFAATGEVHVLGVVRGLGHGLDQNAIDAARRIRFTPALQSGTPVDQHVTLHVVFEITG
jgi:TonB family protein